MRARLLLALSLLGCADAGAATPDAAAADDAAPAVEPDAGAFEVADAEAPIPDAGASDAAVAASEPLFLDGFFPIAADYQQPDSFERWQARGVNTMIRVPHHRGVDAWTHEANRLGLRMIRAPRETIADDAGEENLIAWSGQDEPELHRLPASDVADFRRRLRRADPERPFFINFWGGAVLDPDDPYCNGPGDGHGEGCYPAYIESADWVGADIYPVNRYDGNLKLIGRLVDKLERWSEPRPVMPYIEVSDWDGDGIGPSARQVRAQMWHAIVHGARGLLYFAVRLSPGGGCCAAYDATPEGVAHMMARQHARIAEIAPVLQGTIDPEGAGVAVEPPLEATWRRNADGVWLVVLNFSNDAHAGLPVRIRHVTPSVPVEVVGESRTLDVAGDTIADDFGAYEAHVYRVR